MKISKILVGVMILLVVGGLYAYKERYLENRRMERAETARLANEAYAENMRWKTEMHIKGTKDLREKLAAMEEKRLQARKAPAVSDRSLQVNQ